MAPGPEILENVAMAPLTTLGVGGDARLFATVDEASELADLLSMANDRGFPVFVLGGGSNVLVSDGGWPGLVVGIATRGVSFDERGDEVLVRAEAGEQWDRVVATAVERGWSGIECLSGIPGLVGATPIQNVGAYGQEVSEAIVEVEAMDRRTLETRRFGAGECGFRYRDSRFKSDEPDRWIVTAVTFRLQCGARPAIRYADLARRLEDRGEVSPTLAAVRESVLAIRREKGMVVDPEDPDSKSAGSFFVNPVVPSADADAVRERLRSGGVDATAMPAWPAGDDRVKLSAAWLIEKAGFAKGMTRGRAGISTKHALAIVNRGGASAEEIVSLVETIQAGVEASFGIRLATEPRFVGF